MRLERQILRKAWKNRNRRHTRSILLEKTHAVVDHLNNLTFINQIKKLKHDHLTWQEWKLKLALGSEDVLIERNVRKVK